MDEVDVDARSRDKNQISPLEIAAHDGCSETVARTLYSRSNHSIRSHSPVQGYTILHFAARERGSQAFLRMLLQETSDLDLEIRDRYGRTPLGLAILARSLGAVSLLLGAGADVHNSSTGRKLYPLHLAAGGGFLSIAEILIHYKAEVNVRGYMGVTPLIMAARKGFDQIIERLVKAGAEISLHGENGKSALLAAALKQHWGTSKLLIDLGADVNDVFSKTKETVLHLASKQSTWKMVRFLLKKGADQEASDLHGLTPFLKSALAQRWDIVERYLEHGTNLNAKTLSGWTAMHYAIWGGAKETVELLHKHGAPLLQDIRDQQGILTGSSLTCAVVSGDPGVFQLILEEEAALDFEGDEGWIITHYAVKAQKDGVRELLLSHNLDWEPLTAKFHDNKFDIAKVTPLHIAALRGKDGSIKFLNHNGLIQNIDVRTSQVHCYTPLHLATISHHLSTVKLLLEFGADVDTVDGLDEKTALHHAAALGFADIVQVLLKHGCHPNMLDVNGMTPELLAIESSHTEVTKMLAQHLDSLEAPVEATATTTTAAEASTMMMAPAPAVTPPWRLPLCRGPYVRKVLTGDVSIYAVDNTTCPPALRDLLEQHEGKEVDRLGTPYKRKVAWKPLQKSSGGEGQEVQHRSGT
jgi:ankyrin repeat protein